MKRKIAVLLIALTVLLGLSVPASASLDVDVRGSVAVVSPCLDTDYGTVSFGWGSGFFVNDQYLVTNHHVISDFLDYGGGELVSLNVDNTQITGRAKIYVYFDSTDFEEAYIVGYDEVKDIAVIRLDYPTSKRTPLTLRAPSEEMVGSTIYAVGYPGLAENILASATTTWGKNDSTVTSGTISRLFTQSGTGQRNIQIDCDIKHGNSGGPVVDSDGAVVGVATWRASSNSESLQYAVSIEEVTPLLNQYNVSYTMQESSSSLSRIVLVAVAAVAAVAIFVAVVVLVRRKKAAPAAAPASAPQKTPVVRSYSRGNYGVSAPVSRQPVLIGRGANCALRFPSDAPGVSGSHCTVQWDSETGDFVVTDLNSSYGTFLMTGQKLTPHVPYRLRPGEKFYLADQNNTMGLELE